MKLHAPGTTARKLNRVALVALMGSGTLALGAWTYQFARADSIPTALANVQATDRVTRALARGKPAVIEFGANACTGCREMKPILAELERVHGANITVADIDIIKDRTYITRYQIKLMPTQVFFDANGREIGRHMGVISAADILTRLGQKPV